MTNLFGVHAFQKAVVAALFTAIVLPMTAAAETVIGFVDFQKVYSNYSLAQTFMSEGKVKEADLRKLGAEYAKKIEESRKDQPQNPVGSSQLEKELNDQFNAKVQEFRDWQQVKQKEIQNSLQSAVKQAATSNQVTVVLTRDSVFEGGVDLTNDVLVQLNQ